MDHRWGFGQTPLASSARPAVRSSQEILSPPPTRSDLGELGPRRARSSRRAVERRMRLGDLAHLTDRLKTLGGSGTLDTAFVERINLTLRHALAALPKASLVGHGTTHERTTCPSGVVARLLPFLSSPRVAAPAARCPTSAAGQTNHTPLCAAHPGHGRRPHGTYLVRRGVVSVSRGSVT